MKKFTLSAFLLFAFFAVTSVGQKPPTPAPSLSGSPAVGAKSKATIKTTTTAKE